MTKLSTWHVLTLCSRLGLGEGGEGGIAWQNVVNIWARHVLQSIREAMNNSIRNSKKPIILTVRR